MKENEINKIEETRPEQLTFAEFVKDYEPPAWMREYSKNPQGYCSSSRADTLTGYRGRIIADFDVRMPQDDCSCHSCKVGRERLRQSRAKRLTFSPTRHLGVRTPEPLLPASMSRESRDQADEYNYFIEDLRRAKERKETERLQQVVKDNEPTLVQLPQSSIELPVSVEVE